MKTDTKVEILEARIAPAFAANIALGAISPTAGLAIDGLADEDMLGMSMSSAGDVNGDGIGDFLLGADQTDVGGANSGSAYVIFGKAGGLPASFALSALDGKNGFALNGSEAGDSAGASVAAAGDVNGDGFADILVGLRGADGGGIGRGAACVVFGKDAPFPAALNLGSLDGNNGFRISGITDGALLGSAVGGAGDVNADGFDDIIVGAPGETGASADSGVAYVVFGRPTFLARAVNPGDLNGTNGFALPGSSSGDEAGLSVAGAGDVNGDGIADIIVGARDSSEGGTGRGAAYVVHGRTDSFPASVSLGTLNGTTGFRIQGIADNDRLGTSVAGAGDVNGDGFADVIVGAPDADEGGDGRGAAYVVFGRPASIASIVNMTVLNSGTQFGFKLHGTTNDEHAGYSVAGNLDVNGDGFSDLIVGAGGVGGSIGAAYVVFGKPGGFSSSTPLSSLTGADGFTLNGANQGDYAGFSVSAAGDVNGDGLDDLLVGAPGANGGGSDRGTVYLVYGQSDVPLKFAKNGKSATFPDVDGDLVTVKVSKGTLERADFTFAGGVFQKLNFSDDGNEFSGADVKITAKKIGAGDGRVNLGALDASGVDLASFSIPGDLGQIDVGDSNVQTAAIKSLTVGSLGAIGGTQPATTANPTRSDFHGGLGKLTVRRDMFGAVDVLGGVHANIGSVFIGGNLDGTLGEGYSGLLRAGMNIGNVTVKGSVLGGGEITGIIAGRTIGKVSIGGDLRSSSPLFTATISAEGFGAGVALGGLSVKGDVENARILAGYSPAGAPRNGAQFSVGNVVVNGDWKASSLAVGVRSLGLFPTFQFGANDESINAGRLASIASIVIKGAATGSAAVDFFHYGIVAGIIGKISIGKAKLAVTNGADNILIDTVNNDFRVVDFA